MGLVGMGLTLLLRDGVASRLNMGMVEGLGGVSDGEGEHGDVMGSGGILLFSLSSINY
jgi:hypothetical protein